MSYYHARYKPEEISPTLPYKKIFIKNLLGLSTSTATSVLSLTRPAVSSLPSLERLELTHTGDFSNRVINCVSFPFHPHLLSLPTLERLELTHTGDFF